ncbi:MAG: 6-bladed beta-propeller [Gallionella sp.]
MTPQRPLAIVFFGLALLVAGCAETPKVFRLTNDSKVPPKVWPATPEKPRYEYVGVLTGEDNFHYENLEARSTAVKLFDWLVGLTSGKPQPIVLQRPQSGAVDDQGRVFVTDIGRGAVYVFNKPAGQLEVWDWARTNTRFIAPIGMALSAQGEIWVADAELHSVFRLDSKGKPVGEFGHDVLVRPTGLARDAQHGRIYVADTHAHDVKVFSDEGKLIKIIGRRGEKDGEFNFPTHLAFAAGKLYVSDTLNSRIQIFDAEGKIITKFGQRGLYVGDLVRPKGISVDNEGNIYVIESLYDKLLVFDTQGRTLLALGGTGKGTGEFYLPSGVWADSRDQIYVADMYNGRITVLQFLGGSQ